MNRPHVVVLGATGMLGHKLFELLPREDIGVVGTVRTTDLLDRTLQKLTSFAPSRIITGVDALDFEQMSATLRQMTPDVILNCIGVVKQRDAATDPIPTLTLNTLLPHRLAQLAQEWNGRLIHFSTDCVFSGAAGYYHEADASDAVDLYGRAKYLGEVGAPNAVTLRTSIIGRELAHHRSLLDWFLSQTRRTVSGYRRVFYSGITTNEMARVVTMLIRDHPGLTGLFHVASKRISKYQLLELIRDSFQAPIEILPDDQEFCDRSLCDDKFRRATGWEAPPWPTMIGAIAADRAPYDVLGGANR
jgi:dTDP-4-dehydrorhamnose reductase